MNARPQPTGPHGVLVVDKPRGPTSHDIVQSARRLLHTRQVGHAGTLDPMATGVLVLLLGEATKLSGLATAADKTYRAELSFGRSTDSHDAEGRTTAEAEVRLRDIDAGALLDAIGAERLRQWQTPPAVSAIQRQGQRAYELTRRGEPPELEARQVRVHALEIVSRDEQSLCLELQVSKGYYVRALARDVSLALGVPAHLSALRRLASGNFTLTDAQTWPPPPERMPAPLPLALVLPQLVPTLRLGEEGVRRARFGLPLRLQDFLDPPAEEADGHIVTTSTTVCAWTDPSGVPIAIGQRDGDLFRVRRGFSAELLDALPERSKD